MVTLEFAAVKAGSMVRTRECPRNLQIPLQIAILSPNKIGRRMTRMTAESKQKRFDHICACSLSKAIANIIRHLHFSHNDKQFGSLSFWFPCYEMMVRFTNQSCSYRQTPRGRNSPSVQPRFVECLKGFERGEPEISSTPSKFIQVDQLIP